MSTVPPAAGTTPVAAVPAPQPTAPPTAATSGTPPTLPPDSVVARLLRMLRAAGELGIPHWATFTTVLIILVAVLARGRSPTAPSGTTPIEKLTLKDIENVAARLSAASDAMGKILDPRLQPLHKQLDDQARALDALTKEVMKGHTRTETD